ncbi:MAG: SAM-dependent methyltransferase [Verrucomicrobiales bacterium]|nr:SAM-dependent methyltransferase [Verrucomicrobiales bacterium]
MGKFQDHFSGHASSYAAARPGYPEEMFSWLAGLCPERELAWDVATGNGQAAKMLVPYFSAVRASDASAEQVREAPCIDGVEFCVEPAEAPGAADGSVDLVTVAQAAHWFDRDRFYEGVKRILKPGGVLAMWCYELTTVSEDVDVLISDYYCSLDDYWPPERKYVEDGYRSFDFPFSELEAPKFTIQCDWNVEQMLAYLQSWSATQRCWKESGSNPIDRIREGLVSVWGERSRPVGWPVSMRVGVM